MEDSSAKIIANAILNANTPSYFSLAAPYIAVIVALIGAAVSIYVARRGSRISFYSSEKLRWLNDLRGDASRLMSLDFKYSQARKRQERSGKPLDMMETIANIEAELLEVVHKISLNLDNSKHDHERLRVLIGQLADHKSSGNFTHIGEITSATKAILDAESQMIEDRFSSWL